MYVSRDRRICHPGVGSMNCGRRKGMILTKKLVNMKHRLIYFERKFKATERYGIGGVTPPKELIPHSCQKYLAHRRKLYKHRKKSDYTFSFFFLTLKCHLQSSNSFTIKDVLWRREKWGKGT